MLTIFTGLSGGLVPLGNKPLPYPISIQLYVTMWRYLATLSEIHIVCHALQLVSSEHDALVIESDVVKSDIIFLSLFPFSIITCTISLIRLTLSQSDNEM